MQKRSVSRTTRRSQWDNKNKDKSSKISLLMKDLNNLSFRGIPQDYHQYYQMVLIVNPDGTTSPAQIPRAHAIAPGEPINDALKVNRGPFLLKELREEAETSEKAERLVNVAMNLSNNFGPDFKPLPKFKEEFVKYMTFSSYLSENAKKVSATSSVSIKNTEYKDLLLDQISKFKVAIANHLTELALGKESDFKEQCFVNGAFSGLRGKLVEQKLAIQNTDPLYKVLYPKDPLKAFEFTVRELNELDAGHFVLFNRANPALGFYLSISTKEILSELLGTLVDLDDDEFNELADFRIKTFPLSNRWEVIKTYGNERLNRTVPEKFANLAILNQNITHWLYAVPNPLLLEQEIKVFWNNLNPDSKDPNEHVGTYRQQFLRRIEEKKMFREEFIFPQGEAKNVEGLLFAGLRVDSKRLSGKIVPYELKDIKPSDSGRFAIGDFTDFKSLISYEGKDKETLLKNPFIRQFKTDRRIKEFKFPLGKSIPTKKDVTPSLADDESVRRSKHIKKEILDTLEEIELRIKKFKASGEKKTAAYQQMYDYLKSFQSYELMNVAAKRVLASIDEIPKTRIIAGQEIVEEDDQNNDQIDQRGEYIPPFEDAPAEEVAGE